MKNTVLLVFVPLILAACGVLGGEFGGNSECGDSTCGPGHYCADEEFSSCLPGCKSDENCDSGDTCSLPAGEVTGSCQPSEESTPMSGQWMQACNSTCQDYLFFQCIDENEKVECLQWCETASEEAALGFVACEDAAGCNFESCFNP